MPQKPFAPPPVHPARALAPHVQAVTARAAQAKLPDRPPSPGHLPPGPPPRASHVQKALAAVQAKLPETPSQVRPPAAHVRNAVAPIQQKASMPLTGNRQPAAHVQAVQAKTLDSNRRRVQPSAPFASAIQLATRVLALSDVEVAKYDDLLQRAAVRDQAIVLRAKALAAGFGTPLEPIDGANLGTMTKDDDLYVYGHGYGAGGQMILTAPQLAQKLYDRGLRVVRKLFLKGCQSGSGYIGEVVTAIEAKEIKYHSVEAPVTSGSTDLSTGRSLALTAASQKRVDDIVAISGLDPLGGNFYLDAINAEARAGLVPIETPGAVKTVRSLDSFDPYAHLWS